MKGEERNWWQQKQIGFLQVAGVSFTSLRSANLRWPWPSVVLAS